MSYRTALLALAVSACGSTAAFGQATTPRSLQANILGLLEFCQAQGYASPAAIQAQRNLMNHTSPGGPVEAAEATGRQGTFTTPDGSPRTMESVSAIHHTTVAHTCEVYSQMAIRNASR